MQAMPANETILGLNARELISTGTIYETLRTAFNRFAKFSGEVEVADEPPGLLYVRGEITGGAIDGRPVVAIVEFDREAKITRAELWPDFKTFLAQITERN